MGSRGSWASTSTATTWGRSNRVRRSMLLDANWPEDLIGLRATTVAGVSLGRVVDVIVGASQDRLVIGDSRIEVPMVSELVPRIDVEAGVVVVADLPGLTSPQH